jgi:hypothetical protein
VDFETSCCSPSSGAVFFNPWTGELASPCYLMSAGESRVFAACVSPLSMCLSILPLVCPTRTSSATSPSLSSMTSELVCCSPQSASVHSQVHLLPREDCASRRLSKPMQAHVSPQQTEPVQHHTGSRQIARDDQASSIAHLRFVVTLTPWHS